MLGFVIGTLAGVVLGVLLGRRPVPRRGARAVHQGRQRDPPDRAGVAVRDLVRPRHVLKVATAFVLVFFAVFFNAFQGAREVDRVLVDNARILGAEPLGT